MTKIVFIRIDFPFDDLVEAMAMIRHELEGYPHKIFETNLNEEQADYVEYTIKDNPI